MYDFDGKKQENVGMRITKHVKLHSLGEVIEFLEMTIVDNFTDTTVTSYVQSDEKEKPT